MKNADKSKSDASIPGGNTVQVQFEGGIAWVIMNRPEKHNAMSPTMNKEMLEVLDTLEDDDRCKVLVLTGAGEAFSAGMDLKEYFRDMDKAKRTDIGRTRREAFEWQYRKLMYYRKPTIAMVNGWCFGGAFTPVVCCDLAIAADEATFGLSEINWGIIPAGGVPRAVAEVMNLRNGLYYVMTGETFDGKRAEQIGMVNESVPKDQLRERVVKLANVLMEKSAVVLQTAKMAYKHLRSMSWDTAMDYIGAKAGTARRIDPEKGREKGLTQFLDEKSYRPGLGVYKRDE